MHDQAGLLAVLQHGDSLFPSGAVSFSNGLETLARDSRITDANGVRAFVHDHLTMRWATMDRAYLIAADAQRDDLSALAALDDELDAYTWPAEAREGSRRAGVALLHTHTQLGSARATAYAAAVAQGKAIGGLPIAQGLVAHDAGLSIDTAQTVSAYTLAAGLVSAAIRLGLIGHVAAQRLLTDLRPLIADLLASPAPATADAHAFTPLIDIAAMRHETLDHRLFAT